MKKTDHNSQSLAVVGAGIVGVCVALYLQREGYKVTIYDKEGIAQGASKGNAGHFATEQIFPLADASLLPQVPKMLLDPLGAFRIRFSYLIKATPWFLRFLWNMKKSRFNKHKLALRALNEASLGAYKPLIDDADLSHLFTQKGSLLVSEQRDGSDLNRLFQNFVSNGVKAKFLNRQQTLSIEPGVSDKVTCSIFFEDVGHTADPELLTTELYNFFLSSGGEFCKAEVSNISQFNDDVSVSTSMGVFAHDRVVIAAGAWSKPLAAQLGYTVPLDTERGYHLMLPELHSLSIPVASLERKFIMTPMLSGLRLAGTVEFAGLEAPPNNSRALALFPHAKALLAKTPTNDPETLQSWMGFRPSLPDSLPVIGQAPEHKNIFFAFGHQHLGLTQAAITGQLVSKLITNQSISLDLSPYCISRFQ